MSPEKYRKQEVVTYGARLEQALKENYGREQVKPGQVFELPPLSRDNLPLAEAYNQKEGVHQSLKAIIELGGEEFLSLIEVTTKDQIDKTIALTRHIPGKRAEIVTILNTDDSTIIGRTFQPEASFQSSVSRDHFAIGLDSDGNIGMEDHNSANGTFVFSLNNIGNRAPRMTDLSNPIEDHNFWSAKSSDMRKAVKDHEENMLINRTSAV